MMQSSGAEQRYKIHQKLDILIADDHRLISEAVARALEHSNAFRCNCVETLSEAFAELERSQYDIILLDLNMPGVMGIESVERAVSRANGAKVVLFSAAVDRLFLHAALKIGVKGYVDKTMSIAAVTMALQLISCGEIFFPAHVTTDSKSLEDQNADNPLTEFEKVALKLAAKGQTNKTIAAKLNSSEANIKASMRSICRKLNAKNRTHATIVAKELLFI